MRALRYLLVATFAIAHGVLMPWHLAAAHHTSAANLADVHLAFASPPASHDDPCDGDHDPHEESDHHHGTPDDAHTLEHAVDAVKVRPAPLVAAGFDVAILPIETQLAPPPAVAPAPQPERVALPLGPPGPSPLRARAPPRA